MKLPFFCVYTSFPVPLPVYPVVVVGFEHGSHALWLCENPSLLSLPLLWHLCFLYETHILPGIFFEIFYMWFYYVLSDFFYFKIVLNIQTVKYIS